MTIINLNNETWNNTRIVTPIDTTEINNAINAINAINMGPRIVRIQLGGST